MINGIIILGFLTILLLFAFLYISNLNTEFSWGNAFLIFLIYFFILMAILITFKIIQKEQETLYYKFCADCEEVGEMNFPNEEEIVCKNALFNNLTGGYYCSTEDIVIRCSNISNSLCSFHDIGIRQYGKADISDCKANLERINERYKGGLKGIKVYGFHKKTSNGLDIKGVYYKGSKVIELYGYCDYDTISHEVAHHYSLNIMNDSYSDNRQHTELFWKRLEEVRE